MDSKKFNYVDNMSDQEFAIFMAESIRHTANEEGVIGKNILESKIKEYGYNLNDYNFKLMPLYFDRGFADGYRKYDSYFAIPKDISDKVYCASLDFQCSSLKLMDECNNILMSTTTESYDDIETPKALFVFEDDLADKKQIIKEIQYMNAHKIEMKMKN